MTTEERQSQWVQLVAEQNSSGRSARAFCRDRGISVGRFYQWRKRLAVTAEECDRLAPGFVEVSVSAREMNSGVRLRVIDGSVEIVLERRFDVPTLQQAVAALSGSAV